MLGITWNPPSPSPVKTACSRETMEAVPESQTTSQDEAWCQNIVGYMLNHGN